MSRVNPMVFVVVCGVLLSLAAPVAAQEPGRPDDQAPRIVLTAPVAAPVLPAPSRPAALVPLYAGLSVLQGYDGYSTIRGVRDGLAETNPLVGGLASRPALLWSLKAGSTAASIYLAEQYWRDHHPKKAIVSMIVANGLMAAVAARNASLLKSRR
jgi:hypothetical protein